MTDVESLTKAKDADPFNSTLHLVLADAHDEAGNHDEAAFHRSLGNWLEKSPNLILDPDKPLRHKFYDDDRDPHITRQATRRRDDSNHAEYPIAVYHSTYHGLDYPEGVLGTDKRGTGGFAFRGPWYWDEYAGPGPEPLAQPGPTPPDHPETVTGFSDKGVYPHSEVPDHVAKYDSMTRTLSWRNFKGMEDAFREQFMKNRPQQLGRKRARVLRLARKN